MQSWPCWVFHDSELLDDENTDTMEQAQQVEKACSERAHE